MKEFIIAVGAALTAIDRAEEAKKTNVTRYHLEALEYERDLAIQRAKYELKDVIEDINLEKS